MASSDKHTSLVVPGSIITYSRKKFIVPAPEFMILFEMAPVTRTVHVEEISFFLKNLQKESKRDLTFDLRVS